MEKSPWHPSLRKEIKARIPMQLLFSVYTEYCKGLALQFQGLSSLSLFCSTPPLFCSIPTTSVVLSKRQTIPILLVFLSCIPLVQYIHLLSSWWSSNLLEQQLFFTSYIKQKKNKDSTSNHKVQRIHFCLWCSNCMHQTPWYKFNCTSMQLFLLYLSRPLSNIPIQINQ